jgi:EAL domain-containing protein (putative c-di-GMP-specific phosphodiesterase class I)
MTMCREFMHMRVEPNATMGPVRRLESRRIVTHFQPIFSVRRRALVGLEALSRGIDIRGDLISPASLFKAAAAEGRAEAVEAACRESAVRTYARLPARLDDVLLFLNLDVVATAKPEAIAGELQGLVYGAGLQPSQVAVEFLEARFDDAALLAELAHALRGVGFLMALDDVGAGHSNLDRIPLFRPDVIKIDRTLITGVDADFYKQETLKSLVSLSRRIGALVVAEGIETEPEAVTALELGCDLLQGYYLGRPQPAETFESGAVAPEATGVIETLARSFRSRMVGGIHERREAHRRLNGLLGRILSELTVERAREAALDAVLAHAIQDDPHIECLYVLDGAGVQVTETVCNQSMARRSGGAMFRPAPRGTDHSLKEYFYVLVDVELPRYTTDPYVSLASGHLCRTISTCFRDGTDGKSYVLCADIRA